MNLSTYKINVTGHWILTGRYKRWRNICTTVVGRWWVLKLFYYQLSWHLWQRHWRDCIKSVEDHVYLPRLGPVKLMWGTGHLGHVLLVLSWVGLFVLLCDRKVTWVCHLIKQIFHSSSKNRSDMALGVSPRAIYHLIFFSLSWNIC